jgi:hypothetical protein
VRNSAARVERRKKFSEFTTTDAQRHAKREPKYQLVVPACVNVLIVPTRYDICLTRLTVSAVKWHGGGGNIKKVVNDDGMEIDDFPAVDAAAKCFLWQQVRPHPSATSC